MRDRHALSVLYLEDGLVGVDEETALGNMRFEGRQGDRGTLGLVYGRRQCRRVCARKNPFGEPSYGFLELHGEVAVRGEAVARLTAIEAILARPGAEHHLRVVQEILVDRDVDALNGEEGRLQPVGVDVVRFLPCGAF